MTQREITSAPPPQRATLSDVARLANVSLKTASRALSDSDVVSLKTRARVQDAAKALRFRPNAMARGLRGASAMTFGFVFGDLMNPFYSAVAAGADAVFRSNGLALVMASSSDGPDTEIAAASWMLERRVAGLLIAPVGTDHAFLEGERQFGTPIVAVDRPLSNVASDTVIFDNRGGARAGVLALAEIGHRRIAFVDTPSGLHTHVERLAGYREGIQFAGLVWDPALERQDALDVAEGRRVTNELLQLSDPPTAIFAGNNRIAVGAFEAIRSSSAAVGLLGFDDFELAETLGISVVSDSPFDMGEQAGRLAIRRRDDLHGPLETVVLETRLVLRDSHRLVR